ncbi:MAG: M23 family metallopeptidase [Thermoanaerobaculia bacterium]
MGRERAIVSIIAAVLVAFGCAGGNGSSPTEPAAAGLIVNECGAYPPASSSPYVLPFPAGVSARVFQGNCGPWTHMGFMQYATDFALPVGEVVIAARGGEVVGIREHFRDDVDVNRGQSNYVLILHNDGTRAYYGHFRQDGVIVAVGELVAQGQQIGFAGNTGYTGSTPHLHIEVQGCRDGCDSIPITFRNAEPPDLGGLEMGDTYTAGS